MKDKISKLASVLLVLFICIFEFAFYSNGTTLSNDLLAWGLRREKNHKQPTLDTKSVSVIRKYDGITMGEKENDSIYLTFDCGYEAGYTSKILDILKEKQVKALFFITGHYLNTNPDLVRRMIEEGHTVGNHTVNHKCMPELSDNEIKDEMMMLHNSVFERFGYEMTYFRPPKGEFSERVISLAKDLGYKTVMWSLAYDDWDPDRQNREEYGIKKIEENIHNGAVILLHATSKDNMNILGKIIDDLNGQNYSFKSIREFGQNSEK